MDEPLLTEEGESGQRHPTRAAGFVACAAVAIALLIVMLAPGTRSVAPTQISVPRIANDAVVENTGIGATARLDFVLRDLNGVDVNLASFKGKVILLVILGMLTLDPVTKKTAPFASQLKMNYPILDANDREDLEQAYGPFWGLPTSIVIGRDGRIAKRHSGLASKEQFDLEIRALLEKVHSG